MHPQKFAKKRVGWADILKGVSIKSWSVLQKSAGKQTCPMGQPVFPSLILLFSIINSPTTTFDKDVFSLNDTFPYVNVFLLIVYFKYISIMELFIFEAFVG